ncbi:g5897 [Coccomyxa elongata]
MASRYVSDRMCKTLLQMQHEKLRNFLAAGPGEGFVDVLRGNLLESYTHLMQMQGDQFIVRYLDTGEEEEVSCALPPSVKAIQKIYFLRQPNEIAMVTEKSEVDNLESTRIEECFEVLRAATEKLPGPVYLTHVVPPELYYRVKQIPLTSLPLAMKYRVRQRVMRFPMMRPGAQALKPFAC